MRTKAPEATIILTGIFPRNDNMAVMSTINKINDNLAKLADGKKVRYLNINDKLADGDGRLFDGMMNARQTPSRGQGIPGLGGCVEADLSRTARPAGQGGPCPAANRRSQSLQTRLVVI